MNSRSPNPVSRWILALVQWLRTTGLVAALTRIANFAEGWSLVQQFTFASLIIMLFGMLGIGWWIGEKIKNGVIRETTANTALYMDSFVAPNIQELGQSKALTPEHIEALNNLFSENEMGRRTASIKIWNKDNTITYSNFPSLVGRKFPRPADQSLSWSGILTGKIGNLQQAENVEERNLPYKQLLEIYSPVRQNGTNQIIAVSEFYQKLDDLDLHVAAVQRLSWLRVGLTMSVMYLFLIGFVRWAGNQIELQKAELKNRVAQLTKLLSQNRELTESVRNAAANTTELHERLLRRISAEIHDGPVQDISVALLRLDQAMEQNEICRPINPNRKCNENLPIVQTSLQTALQEMRSIASRLGLPQLEVLTLPEIFTRAVRSHELRTHTKVTLNMNNLPGQATLPIKLTTYRLIQEGLNNAYHHADGVGQELQVTRKSNQLQIEISDRGPGFDVNQTVDWERQIGLAGMQERVESLGGLFAINSKVHEGTKLIVHLPLQDKGENKNG